MNSCELVTFITAFSCSVAKCMPKEDIPLLISMLSEFTTTLATILANENRNNPDSILPELSSSTDDAVSDLSDDSIL